MQWRTIGPIGLAFLAAAMFGAATPASKVLLADFPPFQLGGILYLGAALAVSPLVLLSGVKAPWHFGRKSGLCLLGSLTFGGVLAPVLLLFGLQSASGGSVSMWLGLEGSATAILAFLFFREHLGWKAWAGILLALVSSMILGSAEGTGGVRAAALVLLACVCWGIDNNLSSLIDAATPAQVTFWKGLTAGAINLAIGLCLAPFAGSMETTAIGVAIGGAAYGLSLVFFLIAAQRLGATRAQMLFASSPFMGLALSAFLLHEGISSEQWFALALFAVALWLLMHDKHEHEHEHEVMEHIHLHRHDDGHHDHEHAGGLTIDGGEHSHWHVHVGRTHLHPHVADLHHRH
jgi:drug/metabolite transporter (DMT)-like permease